MPKRFKRILLLLVLSAYSLVAAGEGIEIRRASVDVGDEGYVVNADFNIELRSRQEDAISKGLSLYFLVESSRVGSITYCANLTIGCF